MKHVVSRGSQAHRGRVHPAAPESGAWTDALGVSLLLGEGICSPYPGREGRASGMWAMGKRVRPGWNGLGGSLGPGQPGRSGAAHRGPEGKLTAQPGPYSQLSTEVPSNTGSDLLRPVILSYNQEVDCI